MDTAATSATSSSSSRGLGSFLFQLLTSRQKQQRDGRERKQLVRDDHHNPAKETNFNKNNADTIHATTTTTNSATGGVNTNNTVGVTSLIQFLRSGGGNTLFLAGNGGFGNVGARYRKRTSSMSISSVDYNHDNNKEEDDDNGLYYDHNVAESKTDATATVRRRLRGRQRRNVEGNQQQRYVRKAFMEDPSSGNSSTWDDFHNSIRDRNDANSNRLQVGDEEGEQIRSHSGASLLRIMIQQQHEDRIRLKQIEKLLLIKQQQQPSDDDTAADKNIIHVEDMSNSSTFRNPLDDNDDTDGNHDEIIFSTSRTRFHSDSNNNETSIEDLRAPLPRALPPHHRHHQLPNIIRQGSSDVTTKHENIKQNNNNNNNNNNNVEAAVADDGDDEEPLFLRVKPCHLKRLQLNAFGELSSLHPMNYTQNNHALVNYEREIRDLPPLYRNVHMDQLAREHAIKLSKQYSNNQDYPQKQQQLLYHSVKNVQELQMKLYSLPIANHNTKPVSRKDSFDPTPTAITNPSRKDSFDQVTAATATTVGTDCLMTNKGVETSATTKNTTNSGTNGDIIQNNSEEKEEKEKGNNKNNEAHHRQQVDNHYDTNWMGLFHVAENVLMGTSVRSIHNETMAVHQQNNIVLSSSSQHHHRTTGENTNDRRNILSKHFTEFGMGTAVVYSDQFNKRDGSKGVDHNESQQHEEQAPPLLFMVQLFRSTPPQLFQQQQQQLIHNNDDNHPK